MRKNGMLFLAVSLGVMVLAVLTSACTFAGKEAVQNEPENEVVSEREEAAAQEEEQVEEERDFIEDEDFKEPVQLLFFSGAGAWSTEILLANDGSFTGKYEDVNSGESGNGYVSTTYMNKFKGQFSEIQKLDAETYSMKLDEINYKYPVGEEWVKNEDKQVATEAYGFEEGERFLLYSPRKNTQDLDEELLSWGAGHGMDPNSSSEQVSHWILHNTQTNYGFYSISSAAVPENSEEDASNAANTIPVKFEDMQFDNSYRGPGSEFIGTWHEVNYSTVEFAPTPWEINYKDETFYIKGNLPGDAAVIMMTAAYKDGKLYSSNGTQIELTDYQDPNTFESNLPDAIEAGDESSQFHFTDGYLQWSSELRGDLTDSSIRGARIEGYEKE